MLYEVITRAAAAAALEAVFPCAEMELLWPEEGAAHKVHAVYVSATHSPNTWIDITRTIDTKIESLRAYGSQVGEADLAEKIRERAAREAERANRMPASYNFV